MGKDIRLAGFVMSAAEWDAMDPSARWQLLAIALRRDGAWDVPAFPPPPSPSAVDAVPEAIDDRDEPYAHYELIAVAA